MREKQIEVKKPYTEIQRVFLNSRIYGGKYNGEMLPIHPRLWPRRTFLQRRLAKIRMSRFSPRELDRRRRKRQKDVDGVGGGFIAPSFLAASNGQKS